MDGFFCNNAFSQQLLIIVSNSVTRYHWGVKKKKDRIKGNLGSLSSSTGFTRKVSVYI
jgi:hypothetical protein